MASRDKRRTAAATVLALLGGAGLAFWAVAAHRSLARRQAGADADPDGARGLATGGSLSPPAIPPQPETPEQAAQAVQAALGAWRNAVLAKDADTVVKLDVAFHGAPTRYGDALARSAKSDPDERVRAFSTRVLGKLKQLQRAELFEELLEDPSPYVRQNAAWALGELGPAVGGDNTFKHALAELRHMRARDPAGDVRSAARGAIDKLE